jgi:hypothetical protein
MLLLLLADCRNLPEASVIDDVEEDGGRQIVALSVPLDRLGVGDALVLDGAQCV